jgi:hypothetical protein
MNSRLRWAVSDERMHPPSEQINPGWARGAVAFVLVVTREGRVHTGLGGKSGAVVAIAWTPGFPLYEQLSFC